MAEPRLAELPPDDDLANDIRKISDSLERLLKSGLRQEAITTLLVYDTGVGRRQIEKVLDGLKELAKRHLKKP